MSDPNLAALKKSLKRLSKSQLISLAIDQMIRLELAKKHIEQMKQDNNKE